MPKAVGELETWRMATFVIGMLAIAVFIIQHFVTHIFDIAFEICIFYVPAVMIIIYFFYLRKKGRL